MDADGVKWKEEATDAPDVFQMAWTLEQKQRNELVSWVASCTCSVSSDGQALRRLASLLANLQRALNKLVSSLSQTNRSPTLWRKSSY